MSLPVEDGINIKGAGGWGVGLRCATDEDGIKFSDRLALSEVTKLEDAKLPYRSLAMTTH